MPRWWWMHVSGCPGSHVVICSEEDDLPDAQPQVLRDAALLTAKYSKVGEAAWSPSRLRGVNNIVG
eukprot:scaffold3978_cov291-Pinguiococcus_pyrenoidosus.AAC.7